MSKKELVLFDIGGVLLKLTYGNFLENTSRLIGKKKEVFKKEFRESKLEEKALRGQISSNEFYAGLNNLIGGNLAGKQLRKLISNCWGRQIDDMVYLKEQISNEGYSVGLSSNMTEYALSILFKKHPEIFKVFNKENPVLYSFQIGAIKPEVEMYIPIKGYSKVVFIDDKSSYLETGIERFGWYGIHYSEFMDRDETIRNVDGHDDQYSNPKNMKIANNHLGVRKALREFGISI